MSGTMALADLVADLKASLHDAAKVFESEPSDGAFARHLRHAAADFDRRRPSIVHGLLTLVADQDSYAAPADLTRFSTLIWGRAEKRARQPWDDDWPGRLPDVCVIDGESGRELLFSPPPTAALINILGAACPYLYVRRHQVAAAAADTTIPDPDRPLLLLRAQAEAMKEAAMRNMGKPVQLRDGLGGAPRNGTPAALHELLMREWEAIA